MKFVFVFGKESMKLFGHELVGFAKALAVLVAVFLVSSGLCGLQWFLSTGGGRYFGEISVPLGILELIAMLGSLVGIVLVLIAWGLRALFLRVPGESIRGAHKPPNNKEETKHDKDL